MPTKISEKGNLVSVVIPNRILQLIEKYCSQTDVSLSAFVRDAAIRRLEQLSIISTMMKTNKDDEVVTNG
ncbi:MAG: hypothetical protein ACTSX6_02505 [Candidatus Heimdallarchaeaceae archaeon]